MRRLSNHMTPGGLSPIAVNAVDSPGFGEPNRRYEVAGFNTAYNSASMLPGQQYPASFSALPIFFHDDTKGPNSPASGVTEASLLAIIVDHIQGRQNGPGACVENAEVVNHIAAAMQLLNQRDSSSQYSNGPSAPFYDRPQY